jgi:hypothetical protein
MCTMCAYTTSQSFVEEYLKLPSHFHLHAGCTIAMMIAMMMSRVVEEPQALVVHGCLLPSLVSSYKQHRECLSASPLLESKQSHDDTASDHPMLTHFVVADAALPPPEQAQVQNPRATAMHMNKTTMFMDLFVRVRAVSATWYQNRRNLRSCTYFTPLHTLPHTSLYAEGPAQESRFLRAGDSFSEFLS